MKESKESYSIHGHPTNGSAIALTKIKTGIKGLDDVLEGGIPKGRTTIISGGPGCGKSILSMEFIYRSACEGIPGIFITFEERAEDIRHNAFTLGWDIAEQERKGMIFLLEAYMNPLTITSGDFNLTSLMKIIEGKASVMKSTYLVLDAIDILLRLFRDTETERNELYALNMWLQAKQFTTLFTVKTSPETTTPMRYDFLDFMASCVILLDQRVSEQIATRRLRVSKYRGSGFGRNEYPYVISSHGIQIIPVSTAGLRHKSLGSRISSGHPHLDSMLSGGFRRGSCILIAGGTGAGKSIMTTTIVKHFAENGEHVLYIGFEESEEAIIENMLSPGIDLRPIIESGQLLFLTAMPESMGVEEHLLRAIYNIEIFHAQHVVVDAISACYRMGTKKASFDFLMRLMNYCKDRNITLFLINQLEETMNIYQLSGAEISSLVDTAIHLGMIEIGGEINRTIMILKSRGSRHSNQYREFKITDNGLDLVDVYVGEGGVVTGTARQEVEVKESMEDRRRELMLKKKQYELDVKKSQLETQMAMMKLEVEMLQTELESLMIEDVMTQRGRQVRANMRGKTIQQNKPSESSVR
ncbi:MAG: circadian clock protein KaiC [Desulfobacterales bacterium]|nr:circadian clock protein KaiC [Desulfobacterales bacterium]